MVKYCPRCGYPNPDDAVYCMRCGAKFPDIATQPFFTQQPSQTTQQYPKQEATAYIQPSQQPTVSPAQSQSLPQQPTIPTSPSPQQISNQQPTVNVPPSPQPGLLGTYQPREEKRKRIPARVIIGFSVIAAILLIEFFVILPLVTPNPIILTTTSAQTIFGGSWIIDKSHTASMSVSGNTAILYYLNGSQISTSIPINGVTSGSIETLVGTQVTGATSSSVEITITELVFNSNTESLAFYNSISGGTNNGSTNGYMYYNPNPYTLIAIKNNYVLVIIIHGASLNSNEISSLLQTIS